MENIAERNAILDVQTNPTHNTREIQPLMILHKRSSLLPVKRPLVLQPPSVASNALNLFTIEIGNYKCQSFGPFLFFVLPSVEETCACTYLGYQHSNC